MHADWAVGEQVTTLTEKEKQTHGHITYSPKKV